MKLRLNIAKDQFTIYLNPEDEFDLLCNSAIHEATRSQGTKIIVNTVNTEKEKIGKTGDPAGL